MHSIYPTSASQSRISLKYGDSSVVKQVGMSQTRISVSYKVQLVQHAMHNISQISFTVKNLSAVWRFISCKQVHESNTYLCSYKTCRHAFLYKGSIQFNFCAMSYVMHNIFLEISFTIEYHSRSWRVSYMQVQESNTFLFVKEVQQQQQHALCFSASYSLVALNLFWEHLAQLGDESFLESLQYKCKVDQTYNWVNSRSVLNAVWMKL